MHRDHSEIRNRPLTNGAAPVAAYFRVAEALADGRLDEGELPAAAARLAPLDEGLLARLAEAAGGAALREPRRGWAMMAVADAAARRGEDSRLQALAAWRLGSMANEWVRPQRVEAAIGRARALFMALQEPGWVAACDWQRNALPWTRTDFAEAARALQGAAAGLEQHGLQAFLPACRASLAYALLLNMKYDEAAAAIDAAESAWREQDAWLGVAQCLNIRAAIALRQRQLGQALQLIEEGMALIDAQEAPVEMGRALYRRAQILVMSNAQYDQAEADLLAACELFAAADLPLWLAQSYGYGLARLYRDTGRFAEAGAALQKARGIYARYEIPGQRADNLIDSGKFALFQGRFEEALANYRRAEALYRDKMGYPIMSAVALMYQGETYGDMGRYQQALAMLEEAERQLERVGHAQRSAECRLRMAEVWLRLNQPQEVLHCLDQGQPLFEQAGQYTYLLEYLSLRAEALFRMGRGEEAAALLLQTLETAPLDEIRLMAALLRRYLGQLLKRLQRPSEALAQLEAAQAAFSEMGVSVEAAACEVAIGRCHAQLGDLPRAREAWQRALALSGGALPEIMWRVHGEMATIAVAADEIAAALEHYERAVDALAQLRRWLWQPALAASFLDEPIALYEQAVALAARAGASEAALSFIEESKAHTSNRQLALLAEGQQKTAPDAQRGELETEIRALQEQIRNSVRANPGFVRQSAEVALRERFLEKVQAYNRSVAGALRRGWQEESDEAVVLSEFNVARFQEEARAHIGGDNWCALDYYLTEKILYCAVVTPERAFTAPAPVSASVLRALALLERRAGAVDEADLAVLGGWLLPREVQALLDPETQLLIAPHGVLHRLPWAGLRLNDGERPLVSACIPSVVPSLRLLQLLWRTGADADGSLNEEKEGLLLAISQFGERRGPLPQAAAEADGIAARGGGAVRALREEEATWAALCRLAEAEAGLSRFSFWHIATHGFHDALGGRLSGIALHDQDIWLDHLWQCAPLPQLVTLSACSGSRSKVYTGDAQVGLTPMCLAAGAQTVVGSVRPVQDALAGSLMADFYAYYLQGQTAAKALALAQRAAMRAPGTDWQFFSCVGSPVTVW